MAEVIVCTIGCCTGCQFCYGKAIGCHQTPCHCGRPDQCPECNLTQPEEGHREFCDLGAEEEAKADNLRAAIKQSQVVEPVDGEL